MHRGLASRKSDESRANRAFPLIADVSSSCAAATLPDFDRPQQASAAIAGNAKVLKMYNWQHRSFAEKLTRVYTFFPSISALGAGRW
jgi:hypothetical protein